MSSFQNPAFMVSKISCGIKVTVETFYQEEYSNPATDDYTFAYRVTLENNNDFPVQLLTRHWYIFDSASQSREVEGEGVVGNQPVISSGNQYQYVSSCNLNSEMGKMHGKYLILNIQNKKTFEIHVPEFEMVVPFKMN